MDWRDEGIVLHVKPLSKSGVVLRAFTREHGLHIGFVRGGHSTRMASVLQVGNHLQLDWNARLEEHMGMFRPEILTAYSSALFHDRLLTYALSSLSGLLNSFPERLLAQQLYNETLALLQFMAQNQTDQSWLSHYVRWEVSFLAEAGFGLDLSACAVSGTRENLTHVSPKTGRAVCAKEAEPYLDKLLRLPGFLLSEEEKSTTQELHAGLVLTGHFLSRYMAENKKNMPAERDHLLDKLTGI